MIDFLFLFVWCLVVPFFNVGVAIYGMRFGEISPISFASWMLVWIFCFHAWFIFCAEGSSIRSARICGFIFVVLWFLWVLDGTLRFLKGYHDGGELLAAILPVSMSIIGWSLLGLLVLVRRFGKTSGRTVNSLGVIANFLSVQVVSFAWILLLDFAADKLL